MRVLLLLGSAAFLLLSVGCGRSSAPPRGPSGVVYEGKHVSEWGDQLSNPDHRSRLDAAKVLLRMGKEGHGTKEAIPGLETALTNESAEVRGWAAVALVYAVRGTPYPIGQKAEPVAALKEAAESPDEELRAEADEIKKWMAQPGRGQGKGPTAGKEPPPGNAPGEKAPGEGDKDAPKDEKP